MAKKKKRIRENANVGILSWRASDQPQATKSPSAPFREPSTEQEARQPTKPVRKPSTEQERRQPVGAQTLFVKSIFRCDLKPSLAQKAVLDSLFSGPRQYWQSH